MKKLLLITALLMTSLNALASSELKILVSTKGKVIGYVSDKHIFNLERRPIGSILNKHYVIWMHHKTYSSILAKDGSLYDLNGTVIGEVK